MTEYTAEEDSLRVQVCIVVTGDETNYVAVYICTEGETARGMYACMYKLSLFHHGLKLLVRWPHFQGFTLNKVTYKSKCPEYRGGLISGVQK